MEIKGLNDNKITLECSLSNGVIGKARERGSLSQGNIEKILLKYSNLNANWLFKGDGEMFQDTQKSENNIDCALCKSKDKTIRALEMNISLMQEKISSLEHKPESNSGYQQTA